MARYVSLVDADGAARVLLPPDTFMRYGNIESDRGTELPVHSFTGPPPAWCQRVVRHEGDEAMSIWERD